MELEQEIKIVKELGDTIGYGHLMSLASALWRKKLIDEYSISNGAFVPTCFGMFDEEGEEIAKKTANHYDKIIEPLNVSYGGV